jgi:hypothetical protein
MKRIVPDLGALDKSGSTRSSFSRPISHASQQAEHNLQELVCAQQEAAMAAIVNGIRGQRATGRKLDPRQGERGVRQTGQAGLA